MKWSIAWKIIHVIIIGNFVLNIVYGGIMVFVILRPPGAIGPLFFSALTTDFNLMVTRRLYAIEWWISVVGLSIYLALTEIYPRMQKERAEKA